MKTIHLKNNLQVILRSPTEKDAENLVNFYNYIAGETHYLSFGKNQYPMNVQEQKASIIAYANDPCCSMLLATIDDEIIASATLFSGTKAKSRHVATYSIGIKLAYTNIGLGKAMTEEIIRHAKANSITKKINLVTNADNKLALELYKKLGFKEEGYLAKEAYCEGKFYDTITMALFLD